MNTIPESRIFSLLENTAYRLARPMRKSDPPRLTFHAMNDLSVLSKNPDFIHARDADRVRPSYLQYKQMFIFPRRAKYGAPGEGALRNCG